MSNFTTWLNKWRKQPSTIMAFGLVAGASVYWFTKSAELAMLGAGIVCGVVDDHTKDLLTKIEGIEDSQRTTSRVMASMNVQARADLGDEAAQRGTRSARAVPRL